MIQILPYSTIWWWFCNVTPGIDWAPPNLRTKPAAWFGALSCMTEQCWWPIRRKFDVGPPGHWRALRALKSFKRIQMISYSTIWWWFRNVTPGIDWDPRNLRTKPAAWFGALSNMTEQRWCPIQRKFDVGPPGLWRALRSISGPSGPWNSTSCRCKIQIPFFFMKFTWSEK